MKYDTYSVLMSVYKKEDSAYLRDSLRSIFAQTVPTDDFILVCDGELTKELNNIIEEYSKTYGQIFSVIRLPQNGGLGNALNVGLNYCKNELIARMDSDDVSRPERCQKQLKVFENNPDIDVVSGFVAEFVKTERETTTIKKVPEFQGEIYKYAQRRNPVNHPCVMYKKSSVLQAGGYQSFYLLEDYFLWIRMMEQNMKFYNIQDVLLDMRADRNMYRRRGDFSYFCSIFRLRKYMKKNKFIGNSNYLFTIFVQFLVCMMPNSIRQIFYKKFLRG